MSPDFKADLETEMLRCFEALQQRLTASNPNLHALWKNICSALTYPIEAGGKRVRPVIVSRMAEACGADPKHKAIIKAAAALEFVHTYSLVHDDLPCMDNDDFRRGQPTTHKVFGEANALLVGDALLTHAFFLLATLPDAGIKPAIALRCAAVLAQKSGAQGMIAGQWLDLAFEKSTQTADLNTLVSIHNLKTGALLAASFVLGALLGCALSREPELQELNQEQLDRICETAERIGMKLGLAFQIVDDILDASQSSAQLGKTAGKDQHQNKLTAVSLLGLERARSTAESLTQDCQHELHSLQELLTQYSGQKLGSHNFKNLNHLVNELLVRTS
ncbi:MAG: polyprenyl synthetase family protein [Betaproteobacteria bacterium]|nr:polyprenyl synthetase family protein [Betaproteobacteria bacterium]